MGSGSRLLCFGVVGLVGRFHSAQATRPQRAGGVVVPIVDCIRFGEHYGVGRLV